MSLETLLTIMRIFRTYARAYANDLDAVLAPLTTVAGEPVSTRFTMPNGLELATVGHVLVVAGDDRLLEPYRETVATLGRKATVDQVLFATDYPFHRPDAAAVGRFFEAPSRARGPYQDRLRSTHAFPGGLKAFSGWSPVGP
ncbi:hypothetical protein ACFYVV_15610 [Streptomyces tendae]|uniref:hypothetical protein n=1 Tax=Streptomyces tendae TaxID=1932 RepID=UPI0036AB435B